VSGRGPGTTAFFAPHSEAVGMSALRDALRDLPDTVFADLLESDDAYLLVVDLPGTAADTVDVGVEGGRLVIEARRRKEFPPEYRFLREDRSLFLDAELPLPGDATDEGASASVEAGVLEVRLPKRSAATATAIEVEDAGGDDGGGAGGA
jgi:Molecular chaperone (small heat shock protein)